MTMATRRSHTARLSLLVAAALSWAAIASAGALAGDDVPLELESSTAVGAYVVERHRSPEGVDAWVSMIRVVPPAGPAFELRDAVVVPFSQMPARLPGGPRAVVVAPGMDLTGDDVPNLLLEAYSGGAHCCFSYVLLELGDELRELWRIETRDSGIVVVDLEDDGRRQALFADMSYAYEFCPFAQTPAPPVVIDLASGPAPANLAYPILYERSLPDALQRALVSAASPVGDASSDGHACDVAQLALVLLYMGREDLARAAVAALHRRDDGGAFADRLFELARSSRWYAAPRGEP